ncbi:VOC family protein [Pseudonocardia sp. ICBG1293]|uniref:VOC family protein n=1 Tax=Pseudonocardia sp. ICBG1293 TaxID=2844382 RepID=UPI001CCB421B|nr:VOC family protein [Pseudonocardia sp. ICBG1293]
MSHALGRLVAVTLDCPDPQELAEFYRHVLGGELHASNDDFVVLTCDGTARLDFQRVSHRRPSQWPDGGTLRAHLDIAVDDLDHAEQRLTALGAVPAAVQPDAARFRVLIDPAGHPFCIATPAAAATPQASPEHEK